MKFSKTKMHIISSNRIDIPLLMQFKFEKMKYTKYIIFASNKI
jgi:hypothetical protein